VEFDAQSIAKTLLRATRAGTLATIDRNTGHPFASLVNVATDADGSPLILVSRLSTHTANLERDGRASLLLATSGRGDPVAHPRLTVLGTFAPIARSADAEPSIRRRFLARHPKSELYAGFADFSFWRMPLVSAHLNAGFARAVDLKGEEITTDLSGAEGLLATVRLYVTKLLGAEDGPWRLTGLDPDGLDLALGDATLRLPFPERVTSAEALRKTAVALAAAARSA
jgi:hypothetical protein